MPRVLKADVKAEADAAAQRIQQFGPTVALPVPGDPPPPLREGNGDDQWKLDGPARSLDFDEPVFMALWRYVEAHALTLHNNPAPRAREPEKAFLRAVREFRRASGQDLNPVAEVEAKKGLWGRTVQRPATPNTLTDVVRHEAKQTVKKVWGKS